MKIGIIDADLIGRKNHRFPNLVCMKLSGYWKDHGAQVDLLLTYEDLAQYDKVFVSKVFTDTPCPAEVLQLPNVEYGGTGFFYDKAPPLPNAIEHHFPDYSLYTVFVAQALENGVKKTALAEYITFEKIGRKNGEDMIK